MRRLGSDLPTAVGVLELVWHTAARFARRGDIGAILTDEEIAEAIGWTGKPSDLIEALKGSKWLDEHAKHRLLVHDWPEHCEDSIHSALARAGEYFADGSLPRMTKLSQAERDRATAIYGALSTPNGAQKTPALPCLSHAQPCPAAPAPSRAEPPSAADAAEVVKAIEEAGVSAARARKSIAALGLANVQTVLAWYYAEKAAGRLEKPAAALRTALDSPEETWDFGRNADGALMPPSRPDVRKRETALQRALSGLSPEQRTAFKNNCDTFAAMENAEQRRLIDKYGDEARKLDSRLAMLDAIAIVLAGKG